MPATAMPCTTRLIQEREASRSLHGVCRTFFGIIPFLGSTS